MNFKNTIYNEDVNYIDITITDESDNIINFNGIDVHLTIQIDNIIEDFEPKTTLQELLFSNKNNLF